MRLHLDVAHSDYIADSVDNFLTDIGSDIGTEGPLHLGFTFR